MTRHRTTRFSLAHTAAVAALLVGLVVAGRAGAVSTRDFTLDGADELSKGELEATAVHSDGSVTMSAQVRRIALDGVTVAWSLVHGEDGTSYVGTGNEGKVYRVRGDEISLFAETGQLLVSSLALGPDGTLYAGTLPEGRIFQIDSGGEATELAQPAEAEHIWDLAWDPDQNTLFAATGPHGKVFAIDRQGRVEEYFDVDAGHVMTLALDDGTLYAGTSDEALVLRLEGPGRGEVVYDFPGNEISAIAAREGQLAVAANEFPDPPRVRGSKRKRKGESPRPEPGKGQLWRVHSDGRAEQVLKHKEGHFACVQLAEDGTLYAGTGKKGRIYRVAPDRTHAAWIDVDERQVLALDVTGPNPLFLTGDTGALYRLVEGRPAEATWTSKVLDADFRARWGELAWRADGTVKLQTRSGNTKEPGRTWSDWSSPLATPGPVQSPASRFIQIRARFEQDPDAVLRAVRLFYLPQNQRPVVTSVGLDGDDDDDGEPPDPSTDYELDWDVDNPDDDDLRYRLRFRAEGQGVWRPILREHEKLTDDEYEWDTSGVPDGWYVVEVEASDELSNPESLTLRSRDHTEPLLIDNHDPRIRKLRARGRTITGQAVDSVGPIAQLEYAVDGGEWRVFFPEDHLLDTAREDFELELDDLQPGPHIVAVRATDAGGNQASAEVTVRIPR